MELTQQLQVSSSEYFDFIMESLYEELKKISKKKIKKADIKKGLKYKQKYTLKTGEFISTKTITELEYGRIYQVKMEIPDGIQLMTHRINVLSDDCIQVQYEEVLQTKKTSTALAFKLRSRKSKKIMQQTLHGIENMIVNKRDKDIE